MWGDRELQNFMARNRTQENDNGYEEPMANLQQRDDESHPSIETPNSGIKSEWP